MATILIIDDSQAQRAEVVRALEPARLFERILEAGDGLQGLAVLLNEPVDVVLCSLELPGFDGEQLLRMNRQRPGGSDTLFLFVTASSDCERRARLLENGASDAITKPFHPAELLARLRLQLEQKKLADDLREKNESLARLSATDSVTGLRTRRFVCEVLSIEFLRARRYGTPLCVLMADLDHFKQVNDRYGHLGGDAVLNAVSRLLIDSLRATDVAGRYGGEEILVLLGGNNLDGAALLAERWRSAVEATPTALADGRAARVTISIGAAELRPEMGSTDDLIAAADAALYRAKDRGRNCVELG